MINVSFLTQNTNLQNSLLSVCYRPTVLASLYKLVLTAHSHSDPRGDRILWARSVHLQSEI